jgi:hypothetical protein
MDHQEIAKRVAFGYYNRFVMPRSSYIPKNNSTLQKVDVGNLPLEVYHWEEATRSGSIRYYSIGFAGKAQKPTWYYSYRDTSRRDRDTKDRIESARSHEEAKQKAREERAKFQHNMNVGDILNSSWGYDQTNVNFYQVIRTTPKGIVIREIMSQSVGADHVKPLPGRFVGSPLTRRVSPHGGVKIDTYEYASKWNGSPEYVTPLGMGH